MNQETSSASAQAFAEELWKHITAERDTLLAETKELKSINSALVFRNTFLEGELKKAEGGEERRRANDGGAPKVSSLAHRKVRSPPAPSSTRSTPSSATSVSSSSSTSVQALSSKFSHDIVYDHALPSSQSLDSFPNEILSQILGHLHQPFHFYHYSTAVLGTSNFSSKPWNPVGLQRVSRRWKDLARPLFYFQVAFDASNEEPIDTLRAALFTTKTFRPQIRMIVIFGAAKKGKRSSFHSPCMKSLEDLGSTLADFIEEANLHSIPSDPSSYHTLLDIVDAGNDNGWAALDLASPSLTLVPSPSASLYFGFVELRSKPGKLDLDSYWAPQTRLVNLTIRLNNDSACCLADVADGLKEFAFIRTLRLDIDFALTQEVVGHMEEILQSSTFRLARRLFDDVPMKLHFGLRDEEEAATMREIVEEVGELAAEVFVDVFEV